ncbi:MAG: nucleotidyl transferase AbiEii/AbiGii toxin family protein [bacterium]|nr:nucleotidyl transferase AbiEii/AbiGii toxin family protein [bacterium]
MTQRRLKDVAASVRQRLLNLAHATGEDFQHLLLRYAIERLLYRLSRSSHGHRFILKGAVLFSLWSDSPHRTTRDLDLWSHGENSVRALEECFREILMTPVEDDGIVFVPTIRSVPSSRSLIAWISTSMLCSWSR